MSDVADEVLVAAVDVARNALEQITPAWTIGSPVGYVVEGERVLSHRFACELPGYPGWNWTVTLTRIEDDSDPAVLEAELLPGDDALLAPDWLPWSERLAEYQSSLDATRAEQADDEAGHEEERESSGEDDDDVDDVDDDDLDEGDIDGVDIDELHDADDDERDDDAGADYEADDITGAELAALELQVDESDDAEGDADHGAPEPPEVAGSGEGADAAQQGDEGDEPQH
jgi:AAA ATPase containing von Willebrand factor type A (vWA) domain